MITSAFSFYGGKSRIAHHYPAPTQRLIIEPFCGAAGYAFRHAPDHDVWINDLDPTTYAIWRFLVSPDAKCMVEDLVEPYVEAGQKVSALLPPSVDAGLLALCRAEANQGTQGAKGVHDQITTVGAKCWNARFKSKLLDYVIPRVATWRVTNIDYHDLPNVEATWFVDPPYMNVAGGRYRHGPSGIDYAELSAWCQERPGQVIVAENAGATWLPFSPLVERQGMRGRYQKSRAMEVLWTRE